MVHDEPMQIEYMMMGLVKTMQFPEIVYVVKVHGGEDPHLEWNLC